MKDFFADLHVHIGRSSQGKEIKRATAANLTFENIARESYYRKGVEVIGVVDCISPHVLEDIDKLLESGQLREKPGGGLEYRGSQIIIPGAEIESHQPSGGSAHSLCFFPTLDTLKRFSTSMSKHMRNIYSNSSVSRLTAQELFRAVEDYGGVLIPAHAFTPHKSFYGSCCKSLLELFDEKSFEKIPAIELGLSADSEMASQLSELDGKAFLSNSDAHSLPKIGREYNIIRMEEASFEELVMALKNENGRRIELNCGMNPKLGKYHRTYCNRCEKILEGEPPVLQCPVSSRHPVVVGVRDRLELIKDRKGPHMEGRPRYRYQVPLEFIPGVGPKTLDRLIEHFGSEMKVLHSAGFEELCRVVGVKTGELILKAREGLLEIGAGGGGRYGVVEV